MTHESARNPTPVHIFVYGTLLRGEVNHHHLASSRFLGPARTPPAFWLRDLGPYPGLVAGGLHRVSGEVYAVDSATLAALDRLEGHPTFYTRTRITLEDGALADAYLLPEPTTAVHPLIETGDWRTRPHGRSRA